MKQARAETADDDYTQACFLIEKKIGTPVTEDYPALKFVVMLEELPKILQETGR